MESRDEFNFFLFLFGWLVCHLKNAEREMGKVEVLLVGIVVFCPSRCFTIVFFRFGEMQQFL